MIATIISKFALPVLGALVLGAGGYAFGVHQVSSRPLEIKTECQCEADKILSMINQKLDNMEKANSISIEKLKGFKGNFSVNQNYTMTGDSMIRKLIVNDLKGVMNDLKVSKCR